MEMLDMRYKPHFPVPLRLLKQKGLSLVEEGLSVVFILFPLYQDHPSSNMPVVVVVVVVMEVFILIACMPFGMRR
jgi:hypothetical protein